MCIPFPAWPSTGLAINVAYKPCFLATSRTTILNVWTRSAVVKASSNLKSISCWPSPTSWWAASTSKPILSKVSTISRRHLAPASSEVISKYEAWSGTSVVQLPSSPNLNKWNSASKPISKSVKPISFISLRTRFKLFLGSPSKGSPFVLWTEHTKRPIFPPFSSPQGKTAQVEKSGYKTMSLSSRRTKPSIEEPSKRISLVKTLSNWLVGTSTALDVPLISVKANLRKRTSLSLTLFLISSAVIVLLIVHTYSKEL